MGRRPKFVPSQESLKFQRETEAIVDGFMISRGDLIKVKGEHGLKFKFDYLVTNIETGMKWIDCFEVHRGASGTYRSFYVEQAKRIPKKRKRAKRVV